LAIANHYSVVADYLATAAVTTTTPLTTVISVVALWLSQLTRKPLINYCSVCMRFVFHCHARRTKWLARSRTSRGPKWPHVQFVHPLSLDSTHL